MTTGEVGKPLDNRMASQIVILCEGYHDRSFWAGWLEAIGFQSIYDPGKRGQKPVDPWGKPVAGGDFAFKGPAGVPFVRIQPAGGDARTRDAFSSTLKERSTKPTPVIIAALDWDKIVPQDNSPTPNPAPRLKNFLLQLEPSAKPLENNLWQLDDGALVYLTDWALPPSAAMPIHGVPRKNTLERVVCACLAEAFPARAEAVENWLANRPGSDADDTDDIDPKGYAWSYMAGWKANSGCDYFFRHIWQTPAIRQHLEQKLTQLGHWQVVRSLLGV